MALFRACPDPSRCIAFMARLGYASRGVVYLLVGGLAGLAALGQGGQTEGSRGALASLLNAPFGQVLLGIMALGLLGYAGWRALQAIMDADHHGWSVKGLAIRGGLLVSAVTHTLLALYAASLMLRLAGDSEGSGGSSSIVGWLLQQPLGRWMVGAVGLAIIGAGVAHVIKGIKAKFDKHFRMSPAVQRWAYPLCRFGLVVRGGVFVLVGCFFLMAAYHIQPDEAGGTEAALGALRSWVFGQWWLVVAAAGLLAFGFYSVMAAIYRRINSDL